MATGTKKHRVPALLAGVMLIVGLILVAGRWPATAADKVPKGPAAAMHLTLAQFDDCRALAMRGLKQVQDLKTVCLYGRGFGLDMPEAAPEDMLVEGLWLFDYLDAMDLTGTSLVSYAAAKDHPHLAEELAAFRGFTGEAARRALAYYDLTAKALADAKTKVNQAAQAKGKFAIKKLPADPVVKGPNESIAGDGFRLGWSWSVLPRPESQLGRHYQQHGYTRERFFERAKAHGVDYICPTDGDLFAWRVVEPKPGKFDWSRADEVLALLKKHNLALWLPLPVNKSTPPKWLGFDLGTQAVLVDAKGKPLRGRGRGSGSFGSIRSPEPSTQAPNLFNEKVREAFAKYVKALIQHVRESGVPIIAIDLGGGGLAHGGVRYGGPEAEARKKAWIARTKPLPALAEVLWRQHDYVEYFRPAVAAVRKAAPKIPLVLQSSPSAERNQVRNDQDNELIIRELGVVPYGGSTQSIWDDLRRAMSDTHFGAASTHSGGGNAFAQYAFSGYIHGSHVVHSWPVPMLRGFFWADHMLYPDFRAQWSTLLDWRNFHERAQGMAPEMRYTVPKPQAAILWSRTSDFYQSFDTDWGGGTYGFSTGRANYHRVEAIGWDRLLNMVNLGHDFVTERQAAAGALDRYQLLVLPAVQALPKDVVEAIRRFVRAGGKVIATSAPALFDDKMKKAAPGQLADVFGADFERFIGRTMIAGTSLKNTAVHEAVYQVQRSPKASDLKRTLFCTFKPRTDADVLEQFTSGKPAVVRNRFGKGQAVVFGYAVGREFFMSDTYHMHYGHNWADFPNGSVFQQGVCNYIEGLFKKIGFQPAGVVSYELAPRSADRAAGWPVWQWPRKGGGYRDFTWRTCTRRDGTVGRQYGHTEPRSVEIGWRGRKGNPNRYMTVFSREGAYGFGPGVVHFAAISKQLKIEIFRTDVSRVYDLSLGVAVPTKIEKGRTTLHTTIEPSMARMLVLATGDDQTIRLYPGRRKRRGTDADLRKSVAWTAMAKAGPANHILIGPKDIAAFLAQRGPKGVTISCESPMWLPAARKLAAALKARYAKAVRITRNSPRIKGDYNGLGVWRDEAHRLIEHPDVILGNRTESHYIASLLSSPVVRPRQQFTFTAPLPIVTTHTFPGPGRSAVTLTRPYGKKAVSAPGRIYTEVPTKVRSLIIGGSDSAGVNAGTDAVIALLKSTAKTK